MKKTIAILTTLVLAVLCFPAAQAETGDVIRFQDIPWGSDVETVTQALLDAGTEWFDAAAQIDILLEEGDEIVLMETPVDRGNQREITVKLENMPQRPRACTRLRVRLSMTASDRLRIQVDDMGFGEIFPSSGMKWEQEIAING